MWTLNWKGVSTCHMGLQYPDSGTGTDKKAKKEIHFKASILVKFSISWVPFYLLKYLVIRSTWSDGGNVHTTGSCSEVSNMQASRVNMPPTKHHPVTKHLFCADQRWWMVTVLCASVWIQPYDETPSLEKICLIFSYNPNEIFFGVCSYGHRKKP
jgi:hypothetical protein